MSDISISNGSKSNRLRIYPVCQTDLLNLLRDSSKLPNAYLIPTVNYRGVIPDDAVIVSAFWRNELRTLCLVVSHHTFDVVPECSEIPTFSDPLSISFQSIALLSKKLGVYVDGMDIDECRQLKEAINERIYDLEHPR